MFKNKVKFLASLFLGIAVFLEIGISQSFAQGAVIFGPQEAMIEGSIPYTVIGKYKARFHHFKGRITLDEKTQRIQSVYLKIEVKSIVSNSSWCDKIARSRRLLNAIKYPYIIFKSDKIIHDDSGYKVKGILEMHGVKKLMIFPFNLVVINGQNTRLKLLVLHGSWIINRKDFNIIWNRVLDRGGIVVGDYLTVSWGIKAFLKY